MVQKHLLNLYLARTADMLSGARRVAMMLLLMMLTMTAQTAWAGSGVKYVTANGTEMNTVDGGIDVTSLNGNETEIGGGWYVVDHDITYTSPLIITGDVTLILANGKTMSVGTSENPIIGNKECVFGTESNNGSPHSLTIYGQSLDDGQAGHLEVYASADNTHRPYGIKASDYIQYSGNVTSNAVFSAIEAYSVTLNGGTINATSTFSSNTAPLSDWSAIYCTNASFIVAGGTLTANSTSNNGVEANGINVTGGIIISQGYNRGLATSENVNITGGKVTATGQSGGISGNKGINLGYSSPDDYIKATAYDCMTGTVNILANTKFKVGETATVLDGGNSGRELTNDERLSLANQKLTPVTNAAPPSGDLEISVVLVSDRAADADEEFTFTVTLDDTTISGTYGDMTFDEGVATVMLKGEESASATGLPTDITYTITQADKEGFELTGKTGDTGTISTTESTATFTNTRETGNLTVSNTVVSDRAADADAEFTFTVTLNDNPISKTYGDMTFTDGVATVILKGGESASATGLPTDITYTVTRAGVEGFVLTGKVGDTGTISTTESTATFTNTRETGDLNISAVLVSDKVADADVDFTFTVTLVDNPISGTYGDMTFAEGVATVTLKGGESATATGLPTTVGYTVTQTPQTGFNVTGKTGDTGTISTTESTAVFTNTRPIGDLTVSNTVYVDNDQEFEYTVTLSDDVISKAYGGMTFTGCVATFSLKNGESAIAEGLPTGVTYTVTQTNNDAFTTTKTGDEGEITTTPATAAFKNIMLTEADVSINWQDDDESGRPEGLTVNLLSKLKGSESAPHAVDGQQNKTLNAENSWTVTIRELPKFNDTGAELEYSWSTITAPNGYLLTDSHIGADASDASYTLTKATTAKLAVIWNDDNDRDKIRPTSLSATLIGYGGTIQQYEINADGGWTTTVHNLPMYDVEGALINYTWTVEAPQGYTMPETSEIPITEKLTFSHTPATTQSNVRVNWGDDSNRDKIRPDNLTVTLWAKVGNKAAEALPQDQQPTITWEKGVDSWTASATGLKKYDNGTAIFYAWTVKAMPEGYTLANTQISESEGITTFYLRHDISTTTATLQITWYDADNEGYRPSVSAELYVGEKAIEGKTVTLDSSNNWTAMISNLPANNNGTAIVYTWKLTENSKTELSIAGYSLINTNTATSPSGTVTTLTYRNAVAQPAFAFVESNVTKTTAEGSFIITPAGAQENPAITYSSSNEAVAEVDASTGEVTIKGSGITTITATAAATDNYLPATAKYTLTVTGGSTVSIQLTENYGTFCWNQDLDFSGITGLDAYIAAGYNASTGVLTMVKVTSVPAGTGLLLRGSAGYNYTATVQSSTWVYANLLRGTTTETSLTAGGNDFILGKKNGTIGFYPVSENGKIAANKAYLHLDNIPNTSSARSFVSISFVDDATALDAVRWNKETGRGDAWYSLDGRKLQGKPTVKGLYIHNGKKEAVK